MSKYCEKCGMDNPDSARYCALCLADLNLNEEKSAKLVPQMLNGRYQITEALKSGSMGSVYKAIDSNLGMTVAVKKMFSSFEDETYRQYTSQKFKEEARLLARLHHSGLPKVSDFFVDEDLESNSTGHYLVMTFIEGKDLENLMKERKKKPLPVGIVVNYSRQILNVLTYLHSQNPPIIYRDIKPSNIMVQLEQSNSDNRDFFSESTPGRVFLVDFGIARLFTPEQQGTTIGTPGYAPPEQYKGYAEPRSDIFSLGALMHYMLTGLDPSDESRPLFTFEPLRDVNPNVPGYLHRLIMSMLEFNREDRPESAEKILLMMDAGIKKHQKYYSNTLQNKQGQDQHDNSPDQNGESPKKEENLIEALHNAIGYNNPNEVKRILEKGVDPDSPDENGNHPLHKALQNGFDKVAEVLVEMGADVNKIQTEGWAPLSKALDLGFRELCGMMVEKGADINQIYERNWTPLCKSLELGYDDVAEMIIHKGADVNALGFKDIAPIHWAVGMGFRHITELLAKKGADINAKNPEGQTPLEIAGSLGNKDMVRLIQSMGGKTGKKPFWKAWFGK